MSMLRTALEENERLKYRICELERAAARVLAHDWPGISEEAAAALDELSEALEQTQ